MGQRVDRSVTAAAAAATVYLVFAGWLLAADPDASATTRVVDIVETLVPAVAGWICFRTGRAATGQTGRTWQLVGLGVLAWAAGQAAWTWYEVVLGVEVPFPSVADIGFLIFPVLASLGVALYGGTAGGRGSVRAEVLDGALLAVSLFTVSWLFVLRSLVSDAGDVLPFAISLAYPVGDAIMVTMVLHLLSHQLGASASLWVLGAGLTVMGVADSAFVWSAGSGTFATGGWIDLGWISAFALMGLAGLLAARELDTGEPPRLRGSRVGVLLPYAPLTVGVVALASDGWRSGSDRIGLVLTLSLVSLVLARQLLALLDNHSLVEELNARGVALTKLALHDPLTGLANRTLFADRLEQAVAGARREEAPVALLMVDLDDFKQVNDTLGHAAGDALLVSVAERLHECARTTDTVARLGGDEFAVVLRPALLGYDEVAERILAALSAPFHVGAGVVTVSASVGVGRALPGLDPVEDVVLTERLQRHADVAMYAAKAAGKNRWRAYADDFAALAARQEHDISTRTGRGHQLPSRSGQPTPTG